MENCTCESAECQHNLFAQQGVNIDDEMFNTFPVCVCIKLQKLHNLIRSSISKFVKLVKGWSVSSS